MNIQIPGYRIVRELGEGGMGIVYLAIEESIETNVAIKLLHRQYSSKAEIIERFKNEARLMSGLVHSNIVQYRHFLTLQEGLALVMEYVDGRGLDRMIGEEVGPIPWEKSLSLFVQILQGVGYAHSRGVVHRDIKPSNIIVSGTGEVRITDFGIAKIAGQKGLTRTGTRIGTLYYESPEQIRGAKDVDQRADIYSLGMTLYEMLAGRLPFESDADTSEFQVMNSIVNRDMNLDPRKYYPHIPVWLVDIVQKATHLDPGKRFQNCEEFLQAIREHGDISATESGYWSHRATSEQVEHISSSTPASSTGNSPDSVSPGSQCPECGFPVKDEMEYCAKCGAELNTECPSCKRTIRWFYEHCPKCGVNISSKHAEIEAEKKRRSLEEEEKRIEKLRAKEEAARLEREREAERKRFYAEQKEAEKARLMELEEKRRNRKAWWGKHWFKVALTAVAVLVLFSAMLYLNSDKYKYGQALDKYKNGRWEQALEDFSDLEPYSNASVYVDSCYYQIALERINWGEYQAAVGALEKISSFAPEDLVFTLEAFNSSIEDGPLEGMSFVQIPSGIYQMGSPSSETDRDDDEMQHGVYIDSFELMTTEVTQGMWEEVMGDNPSNFDDGDNYPVERVSWNDCQEFIEELNEMDPSHTYRLPTEAEWEYACRAGTTTRFYWGDSDSESVMGRYCWYTANSNSSTHPVARKEPNAWGLYDMSGNVWEWCQDVYTSDYGDCPTDGSAYTGSGSYRVGRGGSWYDNARYCRSAYRSYFSPGGRFDNLGIRLARD